MSATRKGKEKIDISFKNVRVDVRLPVNTTRQQVENWVKLANPFRHKKRPFDYFH